MDKYFILHDSTDTKPTQMIGPTRMELWDVPCEGYTSVTPYERLSDALDDFRWLALGRHRDVSLPAVSR